MLQRRPKSLKWRRKISRVPLHFPFSLSLSPSLPFSFLFLKRETNFYIELEIFFKEHFSLRTIFHNLFNFHIYKSFVSAFFFFALHFFFYLFFFYDNGKSSFPSSITLIFEFIFKYIHLVVYKNQNTRKIVLPNIDLLENLHLDRETIKQSADLNKISLSE